MSESSSGGEQTSGEDRRESPRVPMRLLVRRAGTEEAFEAREGDLSLGGFAWRGSAFEAGTRVEVRFLLPGLPDELRVQGEVLRRQESPPSSHVRFVELPVKVELALARYLDDVALAGRAEGRSEEGGGDG